MRVLLVEDDDELRGVVSRRLRGAGFGVDEAPDLDDARFALDINQYDCLVLDRMLPSGDALDLLAGARADGCPTPALFLTARDSVHDRLAGFDAGGDDYLVKPFALEELVARVGSLCRRAAAIRPPVVRIGDLELDFGRRAVRRAGILLPLTAKELALLELLASRTGLVVTRSDITEHCWDQFTDPMSNVVDVHVAALRRKLGEPQVIRTVRGIGYVLEADGPA